MVGQTSGMTRLENSPKLGHNTLIQNMILELHVHRMMWSYH